VLFQAYVTIQRSSGVAIELRCSSSMISETNLMKSSIGSIESSLVLHASTHFRYSFAWLLLSANVTYLFVHRAQSYRLLVFLFQV
jgi:hypothetical protein